MINRAFGLEHENSGGDGRVGEVLAHLQPGICAPQQTIIIGIRRAYPMARANGFNPDHNRGGNGDCLGGNIYLQNRLPIAQIGSNAIIGIFAQINNNTGHPRFIDPKAQIHDISEIGAGHGHRNKSH